MRPIIPWEEQAVKHPDNDHCEHFSRTPPSLECAPLTSILGYAIVPKEKRGSVIADVRKGYNTAVHSCPNTWEVTMNANKAYELIKERMISLDMDPGVAIDQVSLARQVGFPPGPVHEAVERLIQEGWLEKADQGVKVTEEALAIVFGQLFEVRSVLETLCARLATQRATEEQLAYLESMMPRFQEAAREADPQSWIQLDQRFHEAIYDAAHNIFLANALKQIYALDLRIWYLVLNRMTDLPRVVESHRAIVQAFVERDARAAEQAITRHIQESQAIVMPEKKAKA
jgi:DNA-binding GntR family transcriptional regulator